MAQAEETCASLHIQIAGGHTEVTDAVNRIVLTVTAIGKAAAGAPVATGTAKPDGDIVVTKWIALEGTSIAAKEREEQLRRRFPAYLVEAAKGFDKYLSIIPEAAVAGKSGVWAMTDVTEGGIFGALWEMAESSGVGLEIDLKKLPIRQETVEICNLLDLNPYELISGGLSADCSGKWRGSGTQAGRGKYPGHGSGKNYRRKGSDHKERRRKAFSGTGKTG